MECESETGKTKVSDSGYSNSFYKSNSHGSASSKSLLSGSNCSSGYGGIVKAESGDTSLQALNKRNKDKDHKKNKSQSANMVQNHVAALSSTPTINGGISKPENLKLEPFSKTDDTIAGTKIKGNGIETTLGSNSKQSNHLNVDDPMYNINTTEPKNGFCCVISMYDGVVLYTSASLTPLLGFPKNMWLGRSFSDFLHPKDRDTFCNQITNEIAVPLIEGAGKRKDVRCSFYVCLRRYRGLKTSGYRVVEKSVSYQAFHLCVTLKCASENTNSICLHNGRDTFLIILAVPVFSNYTVPDEIRKANVFGMRHTAAGICSQVDDDVVTNFGYLPQEMVGKPIFDFYHPEDLPVLKEAYEAIMVKCQITGSVYRSKPYRFAAQNGDFTLIETEWSCFINPWTKKLEFVIGLHRVLQGPTNPNIFETPKDDKMKLVSDEALKEAKSIREEILNILNKELSRPSKLPKQEVTSRCKNLATVMENKIEEILVPNPNSNSTHKDTIAHNVNGHLEQSPTQNEDYDRESSSETPPSYTQLNYNDNINRFFKSKPMTNASDESEPATQAAIDIDQETKSASAVPTCNHRVSGSGSTGNFSSGSNPIDSGNTSGTNTSNCSYEPLLLTEELILRHNEDMEKMMRQRHKELRSNMKLIKGYKEPVDKNDKSLDKRCTEKYDQQQTKQYQGIKRSGSLSWEDDNYKVLKHKHLVEKQNEVRSACNNHCASQFVDQSNGNIHNGTDTNNIPGPPGINDLPLWPPFSVTMAPLNGNQSFTANSVTSAPGMFPVYYFPTQEKSPAEYNETYSSLNYQGQYMRGMMYNPVVPTSLIFCSPMAFSIPQPVGPLIPENKQMPRSTPSEFKANSQRGLPSQFQRPSSQATSVKAEPGSAIGSIASASCVNRTVETAEDKFVDSTPHDEESSYSSFQSSFFKTDTGSGSNDDSTGENNKQAKNNVKTKMLRRSQPVRKCDPAWMQSVNVTPELIYRYQMTDKNLEEVLKADLKALENAKQPNLVNEQLEQLYLDMEIQKMSPNLNLQEVVSSGNSDEDSIHNFSNKLKQKRMSYSTLMMIYEEDAPLPSPGF